MEQQFSLSWKNFHGNLSDGFAGLLDSGEFVDVTLAVDGQLLQAHKVVLSICSPYFKRMFQLNPCQHPIVVLRDVSHRAMKDLIHFMYNGEVSVRQEDLAGFISTAETLEIKGLTNKHSDEEKIKEVPKVPSPVTVLNNNAHSTQEVDHESPDHFSDDLTNQLNQTHNQMDLLNSLRFAARKRKSEEFIANNFNTDIRDAILPEKRTKLREKQILNRHKIVNNYPRGNITVKNFDTKLRRESPPNVNMFESIEQANKKAEKIHAFHEIINSATIPETNGRHENFPNDIKKETEEDSDVTFEDSLPKTVITLDTPPSPRLEQEEGATIPLTVDQRPPVVGHLPLRYHYIFSRKGHKQLVHMNFVYTKHSTSHGKTSWRCVQYFSLNRCPATVETVGALIYTVNHVHNHEHCFDKIVKNSVYEMEDIKE